MKVCLLAHLIIFGSISLHAQSADEAAVLVPVNQLFQGMKAGDSAMVHGAFTNKTTFARIGKDKSGQPSLRQEGIHGFLKAVGTAHQEAWNEVIWDTQIKIDGNFAQVWASYAFYRGKKFSHCGVDAFHLFKGTDGNWKIFHLADTHQTEGCQVPASISDQFK